MKLVVDASVAVKWLFAESHSSEARQLLAPRIVLHAPDFILAEVANVIWKKVRRKEIPSAQPYIEELGGFPDAVVLQPSADLVLKAAALAVQIDHPVYDCVYLACSEAEAAPLVTADARLMRRANETYPGVEIWDISEAVVARRIAAATALVIQEDQIQEAIAAYDAFKETRESVIQNVQPTPSGIRITTREDQDAYFDTPAYLRLVRFIDDLTRDERIDLKALAFYGRPTSGEASWHYCLDHASRLGADDVHYEASLGRDWRAGWNQLREDSKGRA